MTMNQNVYSALLAMDSYNRGYGANVNITGTSIGLIDIVSRQSLGISDAQYADWLAAGFYASAYNWNEQNVISYRGTNPDFTLDSVEDFLNSPILPDIFDGSTLGAGFAGGATGAATS